MTYGHITVLGVYESRRGTTKSHTDLPIQVASGPIAAVQRNNVDPVLQEDDLKEDGAAVVGTKKAGSDQR